MTFSSRGPAGRAGALRGCRSRPRLEPRPGPRRTTFRHLRRRSPSIDGDSPGRASRGSATSGPHGPHDAWPAPRGGAARRKVATNPRRLGGFETRGMTRAGGAQEADPGSGGASARASGHVVGPRVERSLHRYVELRLFARSVRGFPVAALSSSSCGGRISRMKAAG